MCSPPSLLHLSALRQKFSHLMPKIKRPTSLVNMYLCTFVIVDNTKGLIQTWNKGKNKNDYVLKTAEA